ncbi:MAG: creatininase family protein [Candidatus Bathyarchaeota archaeon]|jgi:creatinine amidohydrolase
MTSPEVREALESGVDTVVFAVGSNEQHGPCLPVSTDTILGDELALAVVGRLEGALKGPTVNLGCSEHHMQFPGTITLKKGTLQRVLRDYVDSLARQGFRRIVILPSHGGNFGPISEVTPELQKTYEDVEIISYTDLQRFVAIIQETSKGLGVTIEESGAHAGEAEVSMIMWSRGDLVRGEKIPEARGFMGEFDEGAAETIFREGIGALSPIGILGDPAKARSEHGGRYIEDLADAIVDYIGSR